MPADREMAEAPAIGDDVEVGSYVGRATGTLARARGSYPPIAQEGMAGRVGLAAGRYSAATSSAERNRSPSLDRIHSIP
jgi:hypothetical protein